MIWISKWCLLFFLATFHLRARWSTFCRSPTQGLRLKGWTYWTSCHFHYTCASWWYSITCYIGLTNIDLYCQTWHPIIFLDQENVLQEFSHGSYEPWGTIEVSCWIFPILRQTWLEIHRQTKTPTRFLWATVGWWASDVMLGRKPKGDAAPLATVARKPSGSAKKRKWQEELSGSADLKSSFLIFFAFYICRKWMDLICNYLFGTFWLFWSLFFGLVGGEPMYFIVNHSPTFLFSSMWLQNYQAFVVRSGLQCWV